MTDDINENECGGAAKTDPAAGTGAFFTPSAALEAVIANPPMFGVPPADEPPDQNATEPVRCGGPVWKSDPDSVGMARHGGIVQAWSIRDGWSVEVFAKQMFEDGKYIDCWNVMATIDCEKVIIATVFGGRNKMNAIARFIRNGLVSARHRGTRKQANRRAKAQAEASEGAGGGAR